MYTNTLPTSIICKGVRGIQMLKTLHQILVQTKPKLCSKFVPVNPQHRSKGTTSTQQNERLQLSTEKKLYCINHTEAGIKKTSIRNQLKVSCTYSLNSRGKSAQYLWFSNASEDCRVFSGNLSKLPTKLMDILFVHVTLPKLGITIFK